MAAIPDGAGVTQPAARTDVNCALGRNNKTGLARARPSFPAAEKKTLFGQGRAEGASKPLRQKAFRFPCFGAECRDIIQAETVTPMTQPAFDPFGEPVPAPERSLAPDRASKWLKSTGTGLFWGLVAAIVLARAVYFEPGSFSFDRAVAWVQGLFTILQG